MTRLRSKLPVERLSEPAWARVREEVFAELHAPADSAAPAATADVERTRWRRVAAWSAAAAVAASVIITLAVQWKQAAEVAATSRIATSGSVTRASIGDATAEVGPEAALVITGSEASGYTVLLERGDVTFSVPERERRPAFRVHAGDVRVEVVGTRFSVSRQGEDVAVAVTRGRVRVTRHGESVLLHAGGRWSFPEVRREDEAAAKPPAVPAADPRRTATLDGPPSAKPQSQRAPDVRGPGRRSAPSASDATASAASTARASYEAASALEASDPERAVGAYLELARGSDVWAANALFAAGRLETERGRRVSARELLQRYVRRVPEGPNAEEARLLLERTE
jgi:hypothetical protein